MRCGVAAILAIAAGTIFNTEKGVNIVSTTPTQNDIGQSDMVLDHFGIVFNNSRGVMTYLPLTDLENCEQNREVNEPITLFYRRP